MNIPKSVGLWCASGLLAVLYGSLAFHDDGAARVADIALAVWFTLITSVGWWVACKDEERRRAK